MEKFIGTKHAVVDREERLVRIATTIGFGEIVAERESNEKIKSITNTGVIWVHTKQRVLVTAYVANVNDAYFVFDGRPPQNILNTVKKNSKKNLNQVLDKLKNLWYNLITKGKGSKKHENLV